MIYSRANKPDTAADIQLRECLVRPEKQSFLMIAGAGSGKTTSLIKALSTIITVYGKNLRKQRKRIACITYTEIAAAEIWGDIGNNPLVHVSTIHSFLWSITRSFQTDIHSWVLRRIDERILDLQAEAAAFGPRVQQRTRDKNRQNVERYMTIKGHCQSIRTFTYGTGSDYPKGILGHDDVIRIATDFLHESELFRSLLARQFPFVFVDESQDTQAIVVSALKATAAQTGNSFCLGFFGDPMQRIYPTGIGEITAEENWVSIDKEENFRCPATVLSVANAIRRDGDDLVQTLGRRDNNDATNHIGTARIFILPADNNRDEYISAVRTLLAQENDDPAWGEGIDGNVKILVIVHRMAARRLGFLNLYSAMNDKAPSAFTDGFLDASSWPLRVFDRFIMPFIEATDKADEFEVMNLLRKNSPLLEPDNLRGVNVSQLLAQLREATQHLSNMVAVDSPATVREVLTLVRDRQLTSLDTRFLDYLEDSQSEQQQEDGTQDQDETSKEIESIERLLSCPINEFRGYKKYVTQQSPFSTQQGIKGAEFERVLVILDDDEGTHVQFSYDKLFRVKEPSARDLENMQQGNETTIDRTRRLFYVCCTRALKDLAVIYFSSNPTLAEQKVREAQYFPDTAIFNQASFN